MSFPNRCSDRETPEMVLALVRKAISQRGLARDA